MSKTKVLKEIIEESPEQVMKVIRALRGEADDAVTKVGSGKNLEALKKASEDIAEKARTSQPPAYPKTVVQDELAQTQGFKLEGQPYTKEGVVVPEGTGLPALRTQTLPDVIETTATKIDDVTPVMSKAPASTLAETAEGLKGSVDDALSPGMSLKKKLGLGVGAVAGGAGLMSMGDEQPVVAGQPEIKKQPQKVEKKEVKEIQAQVSKKPNITKEDEQKVVAIGKKAAESPEKVTEQEIDYLKMLQSAQDSDNQSRFINNLLRAGTTIGAAIAGVKPDYTGVEALQKQIGKTSQVQQLMKADAAQRELNDEKAMRDPTSAVSKNLRDLLVKAGYPVAKDVSAKNLKDMGVNVYNLLAQKQQQDATIKAAELKEGKNKQSFIAGAQKVLLKPYQEFQKVNSAYKSVEQFASSKPSGPKDVAMLYNFIKTLDPGSVVREGEIALTQRGMSIFEGLGLKAKRITSGELLNDNFRKEILEIGRQSMEQAANNYQEVAKPFIVNAASMGMSEDDMSKFDYMSANKMKQPTEKQPEQKSSKMVTVQRLSDGKTKVVPASSVTDLDKTKYKIVGQ